MRLDSGYRVYAIIRHEIFITKRSVELFFDTLFFPLMNVILFGVIGRFLGSSDSASATYLVMGALLWNVISINQYNVTVSSMWSVWSHNLTNLFIAPISVAEYFTAHVLAAALRTNLVVALLSLGTYAVFDFNILSMGIVNLLLCVLNLSLFAWWVGIILLGLIFRYGTRVQALSWGIIFLFQPLTASFFPLDALPSSVRAIALALPPTHAFEAARDALDQPGVAWAPMGVSLAMNLAYFGVALILFRLLFDKSRKTGQFARNDL